MCVTIQIIDYKTSLKSAKIIVLSSSAILKIIIIIIIRRFEKLVFQKNYVSKKNKIRKS